MNDGIISPMEFLRQLTFDNDKWTKNLDSFNPKEWENVTKSLELEPDDSENCLIEAVDDEGGACAVDVVETDAVESSISPIDDAVVVAEQPKKSKKKRKRNAEPDEVPVSIGMPKRKRRKTAPLNEHVPIVSLRKKKPKRNCADCDDGNSVKENEKPKKKKTK